MNTYHTFCEHYDFLPFPPTENTLVLYATHIASYSSHSNVKLHMAAIKHFATVRGSYIDFRGFHRLYLVTRGIKRSHGKRFSLPKRSPITPDLLHIIHQNLFNSSKLYSDKLMIWAAITMAYFGFLRVSEYTSSHKTKFDPLSTLLFRDVSVTDDTAQIEIKASKTDPFRQGITIRLAANDTMLCPVHSLLQYLSSRPTFQGPFFVYRNGTFLTRRDLNQILTQYTGGIANTTSHSLRIGAATTAAAMGCPKWLIMSMGRWASDCFRRYIRIPHHTIINTSHVLANCTNPITDTFNPYD